MANWEGLGERIIPALVLAALAIGAVVAGGALFTAMVLAAALIMQREWDHLTAADATKAWRIVGFLYILLPCLSLLWLRGIAFAENVPNREDGLWLVIFVMVIVWATDIGAFFAGRTIGGPRLAPMISPNKTWAGLGGGMLAAALAAAGFSVYVPYPAEFGPAVIVGALLAAISQAGDFFESWLKRRAGVKDSGALIPGHGGLLDRIDGLVFAAPVYALLVCLYGH